MEYDKQNHQFIFDDDDREVFGLGIARHFWEDSKPEPLFTLIMASKNRLQRWLEEGQIHPEQPADELLIQKQFQVIERATEVLKPILPEVEIIQELERQL
jgi:hypothetical protein